MAHECDQGKMNFWFCYPSINYALPAVSLHYACIQFQNIYTAQGNV